MSDILVTVLLSILSAVIGGFFSVVFLQPIIAAIVPSKWRFASFRVGKRIRLKKTKIDAFVRTTLLVSQEQPISSESLQRKLQNILPLNSVHDQTLQKFTFADEKNSMTISIQLKLDDFPEQVSVIGELGTIDANDFSDRLFGFHLSFDILMKNLRTNGLDALQETSDFYIEMNLRGEPDLIKFLRDASLSSTDMPLDITVRPKGCSNDIVFSNHTVRTTGDLGEPFRKSLRTILMIYT